MAKYSGCSFCVPLIGTYENVRTAWTAPARGIPTLGRSEPSAGSARAADRAPISPARDYAPKPPFRPGPGVDRAHRWALKATSSISIGSQTAGSGGNRTFARA